MNLPHLDLALLDTESEGVRVSGTVQCHFLDISTALLIAGSSASCLPVVGDSKAEIAGAGLLPHLHALPNKSVLKVCLLNSLSKILLTAKTVGTRKKKPREIIEVLMVKEPLNDLAGLGAPGSI